MPRKIIKAGMTELPEEDSAVFKSFLQLSTDALHEKGRVLHEKLAQLQDDESSEYIAMWDQLLIVEEVLRSRGELHGSLCVK